MNTIEEKLISDYTKYNFNKIELLDIIEYWTLLRDAIIFNCQQTEEGQKYLENCWRIEQTKPDRNSIRERFKRA